MAKPPDFKFPAEDMLNKYLYDYLVKNKRYQTAEIFKKEANIPNDRVGISSPRGFLHEWWTIFYDMASPRLEKVQKDEPSVSDDASSTVTHKNETKPRSPPPMGSQFALHQQTARHISIDDYSNTNFGQAAAYLSKAKLNGRQFKHPIGNYQQLQGANEQNPIKLTESSLSRPQMQHRKHVENLVPTGNRYSPNFGRVSFVEPSSPRAQTAIVPEPESDNIVPDESSQSSAI